jgi:hypothetical protein
MQSYQSKNESEGYRFALADLELLAELLPIRCPIGEEAGWLDDFATALDEIDVRLCAGDLTLGIVSLRKRLRQSFRELKTIAAQVGIYPQNRKWFVE